MSEITKKYVPRKYSGNMKNEKNTNNQFKEEMFFKFSEFEDEKKENLMKVNNSFSYEFSVDLLLDESVDKTILLHERMKDIDIPIYENRDL